MKLITLNTWGGKIHKPLLEFLSKNKDVDIFCFQEVSHSQGEGVPANMSIFKNSFSLELLSEIKEVLVDFDAYFCPIYGGKTGLATFVRKEIEVKDTGDILLYENKDFNPQDEYSDHNRKLQWLKISKDGKDYVVMNVHGHWTGKGKEDNHARLHQSKEIVALLEKFKDVSRILCGDFNLRPDTESIRMLEKGMVNLVTKYSVASTRTSFYTKSERFADFIFLSPDLKETDFKVLPDEVSDHAALLVEIES